MAHEGSAMPIEASTFSARARSMVDSRLVGQEDVVSTPEFGSILAVNPRGLSVPDYQKLTPLGRDQVALQLYRDGSEEAMARVAEFRPGFEMQHPLSFGERITFSGFDAYIEGRASAISADRLDNWGTEGVLDRLDEERERRNIEQSKSIRPNNILGFKLERFDRWRIEEQVRIEKEEASSKSGGVIFQQADDSSELSRAA